MAPDSAQVALKVFFRIAAKWQLQDTDSAALLCCERSMLEQWRSDKPLTLNDEILTRISHLLNIYKLLRMLFPSEDRASQWPHKPNTAHPFDGQSALAYMMDNQLGDVSENGK